MLRRPLEIGPNELTSGADVRLVNALPGRSLLRIVLGEGRKRQIRRMCEVIGHPVLRLVRVRVGAVRLDPLRAGEWRALTWEEISQTAGATTGAAEGAPRRALRRPA